VETDLSLLRLEAQTLDQLLVINVPVKEAPKSVTWQIRQLAMDSLFVQMVTNLRKHALVFSDGPQLRTIVNGQILCNVEHDQ